MCVMYPYNARRNNKRPKFVVFKRKVAPSFYENIDIPGKKIIRDLI